MYLTALNGMVIKLDRDKMSSISPHIDGGSSIKVNGWDYRVKETVEEILKNDG